MIRVKPPQQPTPKIEGRKGYPRFAYTPPPAGLERVRLMMELMQHHVQMGIPVDKLREAIEYELKMIGVST